MVTTHTHSESEVEDQNWFASGHSGLNLLWFTSGPLRSTSVTSTVSDFALGLVSAAPSGLSSLLQ